MNESYNGQQKEAAIALAKDVGAYKASEQLGMSVPTIYKWLREDKEFKEKLQASFKPTKSES